MSENQPSGRANIIQRVILGTIGTILLGAIGSGVWQLAFAPGVDWMTRVITGWSAYVSDAAYESAALDPRPLSSLILLLLVSQVPLWIGVGVLSVEFLAPALFNFLRRRSRGDKRIIRRGSRSLAIVLIVMCIGLYIVARIGFSVANQAVWVWRVFHTNLARCSPYLTEQDQRLFEARFRSIRHEREYLQLQEDLAPIAAQHGVELEKVRPR